jgi:hypothetical protein
MRLLSKLTLTAVPLAAAPSPLSLTFAIGKMEMK